MKKILSIFLVSITLLVYGQADSIYLNNPKTKTVPFWDLDRTEIKNVINKNAEVLDTLSRAIDLLNGAAIRSVTKTIPSNSTVDLFSLTSVNGAFSFRMNVVCNESGFSVSKSLDVNFSKGKVSYMTTTSGKDGLNDYNVTFTNIVVGPNIVGTRVSINNLSTTTTAIVTSTIYIGGTTNNLTFTQL